VDPSIDDPAQLRLAFLLAAEEASRHSGGGMNIINEFNTIRAEEGFPAKVQKLTIVARLVGSAALAGTHRYALRLHDADGNLVGTSADIDFLVPVPTVPGIPVTSNLIIGLAPFVLEREGVLAFELVVNDRRMGVVEVYVMGPTPNA
jgi:hypothetical protein